MKLLLIILSIVLSTSSYCEIVEKNYNVVNAGPTAKFRTGAIGEISIPTAMLENSRITSVDGLVFLFDDDSYFSLDTLTSKKAGFPDVDMTTWPKYLFGIIQDGPELKAFIDDLLKSKLNIIDEEINPIEIRKFKTKEGLGYWAYGKRRSSIVLTSSKVKDQIAIIFTTNMDEEKIIKCILNGVI